MTTTFNRKQEFIHTTLNSQIMKLYHLPLNLQQGFIHTNKTDVSNTICAFYSRYKRTICIRPEYRRETDAIKAKVEDLFGADYEVIYGDSFSVDTWDDRMKNHKAKAIA